VRRILEKHYKPDPNHTNGPSWLSFIGNMKDSLWSIDMFKCESVNLKSHSVLVVMDQWSRRIIGFGVHAGPVDGPTACHMFNHAISGLDTPKYLSSDHDPLFRFHRWRANLRIIGIEEIKTVPYAPMSHPHIERVIGTIRQEYLDRAHTALNGIPPTKYGNTPKSKPASLNNFSWENHCNGLFQTPIPA